MWFNQRLALNSVWEYNPLCFKCHIWSFSDHDHFSPNIGAWKLVSSTIILIEYIAKEQLISISYFRVRKLKGLPSSASKISTEWNKLWTKSVRAWMQIHIACFVFNKAQEWSQKYHACVAHKHLIRNMTASMSSFDCIKVINCQFLPFILKLGPLAQ